LSKWTIIENEEYVKTIKHVPKAILEKVEKLRSQMEDDPFINDADKRPLKNKCEGLYEQKIENFRLIFRILNYNSKKVEFTWIRQKPHATSKRWVP
jgi:mRNA-degrading endonuclease RelE of RelBE toxin-antitoxin system